MHAKLCLNMGVKNEALFLAEYAVASSWNGVFGEPARVFEPLLALPALPASERPLIEWIRAHCNKQLRS